MIERKTVIDQIEIARGGTIYIRFALLLVEDGNELSSQWHRTAIAPGGDVDKQIASVEADITTRPSLRASAVDREKIPLLKSVCRLVHTPDVIAAYKEAMARSQLEANADASRKKLAG